MKDTGVIMTYKLPKMLKLDIKKWRCGGWSDEPKNKSGKGTTSLKNSEGYMCCLGQFAVQSKVNSKLLVDLNSPENLNFIIIGLSKIRNYFNRNTNLSKKCMDINDDEDISVKKKIELLDKVLKRAGYKLKIVNAKYIT